MLHVFDSTDKKRIKSHLRNLIHLAHIDGHFDDAERAIVQKMATKFGVTNEELEHMIKDEDHFEYHPPVDLEERFELLYDIVMMMLADNELAESELKMFRMCALGLNFNHEKLDELTQYLIEKAPVEKDVEILFKGFKRVILN